MYYIVEAPFLFFLLKLSSFFFFSYSIYGIWAPSSGNINIQKSSHLLICLIVQPNKQNNSHTHRRLRVQSPFRMGILFTLFYSFQQYQIQTASSITIFNAMQNLHVPNKTFQHFSFKRNYSLKKISRLVKLRFCKTKTHNLGNL